ncbi:MAG: adenosylcobinamide-GDP ribazoletransferase [Rikenellaceae bacterium]
MNTLFNAILYYSRIPIPFRVHFSDKIMSRALKYLPLVGLMVGAVGWATLWASSLFLPQNVATVVAICAMVLTTGALHEDGFADFCDGFGGGYTKESTLRIMKDSHIGCYGVIGLILVFLLRYTLLGALEMGHEAAAVMILAQGASRFAPVVMVRTSTYARSENSKTPQSALGISMWGVVTAMVIALAPLAILGWPFALSYIGVMAVVFALFRGYIHSRIKGFTGDTLGALQIIGEIIFYVTFMGAKNLL